MNWEDFLDFTCFSGFKAHWESCFGNLFANKTIRGQRC